MIGPLGHGIAPDPLITPIGEVVDVQGHAPILQDRVGGLEIPEIEQLDPLVEEKLSTIQGLNIREVCIVTKEIKTKVE